MAKGIIFKESLFNLVVNGTKTMTRRVIKPQPVVISRSPDRTEYWGRNAGWNDLYAASYTVKPRYKVGETLIVQNSSEWKEINTDIGKYRISKFGEVYSCITKKYLKQRLDIFGYCVVRMNGESKKVHRLVAELFVENPNKHKVVDHIDGIKTNNSYENLRWVTQKENCNNPSTKKNINNKGKVDIPVIDSINGRGTWDSNPYVFCYSFKLVK